MPFFIVQSYNHCANLFKVIYFTYSRGIFFCLGNLFCQNVGLSIVPNKQYVFLCFFSHNERCDLVDAKEIPCLFVYFTLSINLRLQLNGERLSSLDFGEWQMNIALLCYVLAAHLEQHLKVTGQRFCASQKFLLIQLNIESCCFSCFQQL